LFYKYKTWPRINTEPFRTYGIPPVFIRANLRLKKFSLTFYPPAYSNNNKKIKYDKYIYNYPFRIPLPRGRVGRQIGQLAHAGMGFLSLGRFVFKL